MRVSLLAKVLHLRRELRRRESWSRPDLLAHQTRALGAMRKFAYSRSAFYRRFHHGLTDAPLSELPVMTKALLMQHFDEVVTDRDLRLSDVQSFLPRMHGAQLFQDRYYVAATAGTTGRPGLFLWDTDEWAGILASYNRPYAWGGAALRLTKRTKMAVVSSKTPWHQSALVGATVDSPFIPTLRLDSGTPLEQIGTELDTFNPDVLVGYASMLRLLAAEQLYHRLHVSPMATFSASEVLTDGTRRTIERAWGREPFNVYAATETAGVAAECEHRFGMHLFEDLVITEVVDDDNRAVPVGEFGTKVLVTVLGSRTVPLIRYEMSDSVRLASIGPCPCGRPFARIDGIQGREQESLRMAGSAGADVVVQPVVFHRIMDTVPVAAWQVVQDNAGLGILLSGPADDFEPDRLVAQVRRELAHLGVAEPRIRLQQVDAIPRTALGKSPLIRSTL